MRSERRNVLFAVTVVLSMLFCGSFVLRDGITKGNKNEIIAAIIGLMVGVVFAWVFIVIGRKSKNVK